MESKGEAEQEGGEGAGGFVEAGRVALSLLCPAGDTVEESPSNPGALVFTDSRKQRDQLLQRFGAVSRHLQVKQPEERVGHRGVFLHLSVPSVSEEKPY